jgi:hypothetical protein
MIRPKTFIIIFSASFFLFLTACEEKKATDAKDFNKNLSSFNKNIRQADKTMDLIDQMEMEITKVMELKNEGKITSEEATKRLDIIRNKFAKKLSKLSPDNNTPVVLPTWAIKLGLTLPENMKPDKNLSIATSESDPATGYNSLSFVFKGDYETAIREAKKIAMAANIPESDDFKEARRLSEELGLKPVKGAVYMNFEIGKDDDQPYHIAITVDESGILTLSATDVRQLKKLESFRNN